MNNHNGPKYVRPKDLWVRLVDVEGIFSIKNNITIGLSFSTTIIGIGGSCLLGYWLFNQKIDNFVIPQIIIPIIIIIIGIIFLIVSLVYQFYFVRKKKKRLERDAIKMPEEMVKRIYGFGNGGGQTHV